MQVVYLGHEPKQHRFLKQGGTAGKGGRPTRATDSGWRGLNPQELPGTGQSDLAPADQPCTETSTHPQNSLGKRCRMSPVCRDFRDGLQSTPSASPLASLSLTEPH